MKKNEDFGLPAIDEGSAKIVNYIFKRFRGAIPALKYAADSVVALDSIRAEYTYALMRSSIKDLEIINLGIERVIDSGTKFLPPPGEFIGLCKIESEKIETEKKILIDRERFKIENEEKLFDEKVTAICIKRGIVRPRLSSVICLDPTKLEKYFSDMKIWNIEFEKVKKEESLKTEG